MSKEDFSFYLPIDYLEKGGEHGKAGAIDVKIGGPISTDAKDFDGENVNQAGLNFDLWKGGFGRIKYEHNKDPKYFIGFPNGVLRKGGATFMEGRIFATPNTPQYEIASQCVGDINNILAYNKAHPDNPRRIGFSVEGGVLERKGKQILKSVVTNVVITANPRNPQTYVELLKSFEAGSATAISDMTGGQAGRVQNLEGNHKNITIGVKSMNFKSKDEVISYLTGKGMPENEAKEKANEWQTAKDKTTAKKERYEKSLGLFDTALDQIEAIVKSLEANEEIKVLEKSFEATIGAAQTHDNVDPVPFMKSIGEGILTVQKSATAQNAQNANILGVMLGMTKELFEMNKSLSDDVELLLDRAETLIEENSDLKKSLDNLDLGVVTGNLDGKQKAGADAKDEPKDINKVQAKTYLKKSLETATDENLKKSITDAITTVELFGFNGLEKGLQEEIKKSFEDK